MRLSNGVLLSDFSFNRLPVSVEWYAQNVSLKTVDMLLLRRSFSDITLS